MRLRPEEIQVGDILEAGDRLQYHWKVVAINDQDVRLKGIQGTEREIGSKLNGLAFVYNFIHSGKYSNLLPYHDRS